MKIGFIGCGNMGSAILQGILQGGTPAADIYVADHNLETLRQRLGHTGVQICRSNTEVAALCDAVFLAVKPNVLSAVLAEIGPVLSERTTLPLLISIACPILMLWWVKPLAPFVPAKTPQQIRPKPFAT